MICLDTNYLIRGVSPGSDEAAELMAWAEAGEILTASTPAWYEFLCGPVSEDQTKAIRAFLTEILPFGEAEASEAARLFNAIRRKRALRTDAMIAGTAISAGAQLATNNRSDFSAFVAHGLKLL